MSRVLIALMAIAFLASCGKNNEAVDAAKSAGLENIFVMDEMYATKGTLGCTSDDYVGYMIRANDRHGDLVTVGICCTVWFGCSAPRYLSR